MAKTYNRRKKDYHKDRRDSIHYLDNYASELLAYSYSRTHPEEKTKNSLIQYGCVAVCLVDRVLWVASNQSKITSDDTRNLMESIKSDNIQDVKGFHILTDEKKEMHAEMQLLSQLRQSSQNPHPRYIGVSKPCCGLCAEELDKDSIKYDGMHTVPQKKWVCPPESKKQPGEGKKS